MASSRISLRDRSDLDEGMAGISYQKLIEENLDLAQSSENREFYLIQVGKLFSTPCNSKYCFSYDAHHKGESCATIGVWINAVHQKSVSLCYQCCACYYEDEWKNAKPQERCNGFMEADKVPYAELEEEDRRFLEGVRVNGTPKKKKQIPDRWKTCATVKKGNHAIFKLDQNAGLK